MAYVTDYDEDGLPEDNSWAAFVDSFLKADETRKMEEEKREAEAMAAKKAENSGSSKPKIISNITCVEDLKARWETARNWSPDYYNLKDDLVYLIVYDQLKVGEPFAGLLDHCPYLGEAETLDDCLTMRTFEHEGTTSPVVLNRINPY